ncbi:SGNH/GDSL hydrolase family protein [Streptomyces sp. NPDC001404]|uniref:SGNH/GDSL hydrolase family protein n=1 Tax=Streptomyces sp. NPDC001404 TaxID=3364571 RepID=UPI0036AC314B
MPPTWGRSRSMARRAAAAAACAALLLPALAGCDSGGSEEKGSRAAAKPEPSPRPVWNTRPASIASLGDSITRGFDACSVLADCPEVSWATGTQVDSLARRLLPSPETSSWNFAKTGARAADLPRQMQAAIEQKPELVTVLIGANDACRPSPDDMTSAEQFRTHVETAVKELRRSLPKSQLYMAGIPDLKRLWSEGRKDPLGKQVWKLASVCPSMLHDADAQDAASDERRTQVDRRVGEYNAVLKDVCGRDELCRYDDSVHGYAFTGEQLSQWDRFHPSRQGQQTLADMAYKAVTAKR